MWQNLYDNFIGQINTSVVSVSNNMSGAIAGPLGAAMTIYIIWYGIAILRGNIQEPIIDFIIRGLKLVVIWTVAASAGGYTTWAGNAINSDLPAFLTELMGGDVNMASDRLARVGQEIIGQIEKASLSLGVAAIGTKLLYAAYIIVVLIAIGVLSAIIFAMTMWAFVALNLVAAVGPLFVAFALFDFSRGWFIAWLGQILNFFLLALLVSILGVFAADFSIAVYNSSSGKEFGIAVANIIVGGPIFVFLFFLLPSLASGLSSGAQASTGFAQRAVEGRLGRSRGPGGSNNAGGSANRN